MKEIFVKLLSNEKSKKTIFFLTSCYSTLLALLFLGDDKAMIYFGLAGWVFVFPLMLVFSLSYDNKLGS